VAESWATIGGGVANTVSAPEGTVAGGAFNNALGFSATVGGGGGNAASGEWATIAGGRDNLLTNANYATIGGGLQNTILTNADFATIGGGGANTIQKNGHFATIPGGRFNSATNYAFAAGNRAKANHAGTFVWDHGKVFISGSVEKGVKAIHDLKIPVVLNTLRFPLSVITTIGQASHGFVSREIAIFLHFLVA
jgi:hypothetical protein